MNDILILILQWKMTTVTIWFYLPFILIMGLQLIHLMLYHLYRAYAVGQLRDPGSWQLDFNSTDNWLLKVTHHSVWLWPHFILISLMVFWVKRTNTKWRTLCLYFQWMVKNCSYGDGHVQISCIFPFSWGLCPLTSWLLLEGYWLQQFYQLSSPYSSISNLF